MVKEDYVSFETAKLLKEKGFDEECFAYYYVMPHKTVIAYDKDFPKNSDLSLIYANLEFGSLPTLQMAMKWLRKIYSLEIYPYHDFPKVGDKWWFEIIKYPNTVSEYESETAYNTYEEACEFAIKYCIEKLI